MEYATPESLVFPWYTNETFGRVMKTKKMQAIAGIDEKAFYSVMHAPLKVNGTTKTGNTGKAF